MRKNIKINLISDIKAKSGSMYLKLNDTYSIFEQNVIDQIKSNYGKTLCFDVAENGNYKNIRSLGEQEDSNAPYDTTPQAPVAQISHSKPSFPLPGAIQPKPQKLKQNKATFKGTDMTILEVFFESATDLESQVKALKSMGYLTDDSKAMEKIAEAYPEEPIQETLV